MVALTRWRAFMWVSGFYMGERELVAVIELPKHSEE
jgi:hypothetical protein